MATATTSTSTTTTTTTSSTDTTGGAARGGGTTGGSENAISLKKIRAPEQSPRMIGGDPTMDDLRSRLNDNFTNIENTINNILTIINTTTTNIGFGTAAGEWVIGESLADTTAPYETREYLTSGNRAIQVTPDDQIIVMWVEDTSGTTDKTACFLKARSPYTQWTNLAETSGEPTRQAFVTSWGGGGAFQPCFCINPETEDLLVIGHSGAGRRVYVFANDGNGKWTYDANYAAETTARNHKLAHIVASGDYLIYLSYGINAQTIGATSLALKTAETNWNDGVYWDRYWDTGTSSYGAFAAIGEQQRAIPMGGGKLLVLMDFIANGAQSNIAWALSEDDGVTFPATTIPSPLTNLYRGIGYPGDATGFLFPATTTTFPTANLMGSGTTSSACATWEAFRIGDTQRVGLIYSGVMHSTSGSQRAGTFYAEFDVDTLTWTDQADHMRLTTQGVVSNPGGTPTLPTSDDGSASYRNVTGKAICTADDTVRCFWQHTFDRASSTGDTMAGIAVRKLAEDGAADDTTDWHAMRMVKEFGGTNAGQFYRNTEFCGANATVEISGVSFYPVLWTRQRGAVEGSATHELCFQLLPIPVLDAP